MILTDLHYVSINYRHDLDILILRWRNTASSDKCKEGYKCALNLAHDNSAFYWMVDIRERGLTTSKDHLEYLEQRLKSFSKKNNSNIYIAKLITPKTQNPDLVLEKKQRHKALQHINFEYFFTESQAITWLKTNQAA